MDYPQHVTLIEVGPRDGLQNESVFIPTKNKIELINLLSESGLKNIEVTSFVSEKAIPQLADNQLVFKDIQKIPGVSYSALVPNEQGMRTALELGVKSVAVFTAASDTFTQRNVNADIEETMQRFESVFKMAKDHQVFVRAYVSCAMGCPYEGNIDPLKVSALARRLKDQGADEICLGDTIGVGTPEQTRRVLDAILTFLPLPELAMHFHDTYGQAIANIYASLQYGVHRFDSAVAGLGGCPYARGATGNVATEDVLYLMHGLGIETGVDIYKIVMAGDMICKSVQKRNQSKAACALLANPC